MHKHARNRRTTRKILHWVAGTVMGIVTSTICGLPYAHSIALAYEHITTPVINVLPVLPVPDNIVNTGSITTSISGSTITCSASSGGVSLSMSHAKSICMGN